MAATLVKASVKVGIGVGAVYVTLDQGIWSSSHQSNTALQRFRTKVVPATSDYLSQVPSATEVKDKTVDNWNYDALSTFVARASAGVHKVFGGLASTPNMMSDYSKKAVDEIKKSLK